MDVNGGFGLARLDHLPAVLGEAGGMFVIGRPGDAHAALRGQRRDSRDGRGGPRHGEDRGPFGHLPKAAGGGQQRVLRRGVGEGRPCARRQGRYWVGRGVDPSGKVDPIRPLSAETRRCRIDTAAVVALVWLLHDHPPAVVAAVKAQKRCAIKRLPRGRGRGGQPRPCGASKSSTGLIGMMRCGLIVSWL